MANSFKERLHKGYAQSMELSGKPIVEEKSQFQRIRIFDTVANGRVMTLDDLPKKRLEKALLLLWYQRGTRQSVWWFSLGTEQSDFIDDSDHNRSDHRSERVRGPQRPTVVGR